MKQQGNTPPWKASSTNKNLDNQKEEELSNIKFQKHNKND
jgi:hypothetical protein